jgi:hypothetical protein
VRYIFFGLLIAAQANFQFLNFRDGKWTALGTRNRTVHAFVANPYGGPADVRSHLLSHLEARMGLRCVAFFMGFFNFVNSFYLI